MWTPATRAEHSRSHLRYASDLTDAEWVLLEPSLPCPAGRGGAGTASGPCARSSTRSCMCCARAVRGGCYPNRQVREATASRRRAPCVTGSTRVAPVPPVQGRWHLCPVGPSAYADGPRTVRTRSVPIGCDHGRPDRPHLRKRRSAPAKAAVRGATTGPRGSSVASVMRWPIRTGGYSQSASAGRACRTVTGRDRWCGHRLASFPSLRGPIGSSSACMPIGATKDAACAKDRPCRSTSCARCPDGSALPSSPAPPFGRGGQGGQGGQGGRADLRGAGPQSQALEGC